VVLCWVSILQKKIFGCEEREWRDVAERCFGGCNKGMGQPPDTLWTRVYGGPRWDWAYAVQQTRDGGYIIAGLTESFGGRAPSCYVVKTDSAGDTLWTRTYGRGSYSVINDVLRTPDGGYVIGGYVSSKEKFWDFYFAKLDSAGNVEWERTLGDDRGDFANAIGLTSDGGFVFAGLASLKVIDRPDTLTPDYLCGMYVVKVDIEGNIEWSRIYKSNTADGAEFIHQTPDGGFILGGSAYCKDITMGGYDYYLLKTDSEGNPEWEKYYGDRESEHLYNAIPTTDGGYVLGGNIEGEDWSMAFIIGVSSVGDTLWTKRYWEMWGNFYIRDIEKTSDGGFVLVGDKSAGKQQKRDMFLLKLNSKGDKLWSCTYGSKKSDIGHAVCGTADGGYLIAGTTGFDEKNRDLYLVKTCPERKE
jgi:hypothetical protein